MPRFNYIALDARGQESTGLVEAGSPNEVIGQLRQAGYFPTSVFEEGKGAGRDGKARAGTPAVKAARAPKTRGPKAGFALVKGTTIKGKLLISFTRRLSIMNYYARPFSRTFTGVSQ